MMVFNYFGVLELIPVCIMLFILQNIEALTGVDFAV
jgi:hypothetical protein